MRTLLAAHQPDLLPYTGWWYKLASVDTFDLAIWDEINWKGYTARVQMKGSWASLRCQARKPGQRISDVRLTPAAVDELLRIVRGRYQGSRNWTALGERVLAMIDEARAEKLWQFNLALLLGVRDLLNIQTPISIAPAPTLPGSDGIGQLCWRYNAYDYLSGVGGKAYMDLPELKRNAVRVYWSRHEPWTEDSILTTLFEKEEPMAWVRREQA